MAIEALLLAFFFIGVLYMAVVYHRRATYWQRRGVPGPPTRLLSGNMHSWRHKNLVQCLRAWTSLYGKTYGIQEGAYSVLVTSDIALLNEVFVEKSNQFHARKLPPLNGDVDTIPRVSVFHAKGARWKRLRGVVVSVFTSANMRKILPMVNEASEGVLRRLAAASTSGHPLDIQPYLQEFTMTVISHTAMGLPASEFTPLARGVFGRAGRTPFVYYSFIFPELSPRMRAVSAWTASARRDPLEELRTKVSVEVGRRKGERDERVGRGEPLPAARDFIDFFLELESHDAYDHTRADSAQPFNRVASRVARELTVDEVSGMCITFLLAGFDTTANALGVTCYYLAVNPAVQERLREEIDGVAVGDGDEGLSYQQLERLKYAEACVNEALRMVPVGALASSRLCMETTTIGPYTIEAGTYVQADVFACHYDSEVWGGDVDEYRPERMLDHSRRHLLASWLPFGAGPRKCPGMQLALLESKSMLFHLLRDYRLVPCAETELKLTGGMTLGPQRVMVRLMPRD